MHKLSLTCIFFVLLTGCMTVGPDYQRPEVETPETWRFEEKEARELGDISWWERFQDPVLNDLVEKALQGNRDLRIATARVEEFFGRYFSTRGDQYPFAGAGGSAYRQSVTEEGPNPVPPGTDTTYNQYEAFLGGTWEIDFWGKYRRASESAQAELFSTEEARRTVVQTLVSAVAITYVEIRAQDKQLEVTRRTAQTRRETLELFQLRFDEGIISEVDLVQAESEYADALARIPSIERSIGQLENALSVFLGQNPGSIPRGLTIDKLVLPEVPQGMPSDLLERRPDIRQAEQELVAANARIGVAKSLYFPTISLTGAFGGVSTDLSDLFNGSAKQWNYGVPVTVPIFTAGRIGGEVKAAEASQEQALESYLLTVQNAFRDVEDALIDRTKSGQRLEALDRQVKALRKYVNLAGLRYDEGYTSYLEVLDADRSLFNVELSYISSQNDLFRATVNIYKTMGGNWIEAAEQTVTPAPVKEAGFVP
jgi:multidrug efflux system outer membrane protein